MSQWQNQSPSIAQASGSTALPSTLKADKKSGKLFGTLILVQKTVK